MCLRQTYHPYITIDSGTAVPSTVGCLKGYPENNFIFTFTQMIRNVPVKGGVAVFPVTEAHAVYIDGRIHVNTFEAQNDTFATLCSGRGIHKFLPIPADAVFVQVLRIIDQPVVRQVCRLHLPLPERPVFPFHIQCCFGKIPVIIP